MKNDTISPCLLEGAKKLVTRIGSPAKLLDFLQTIMVDLHNCDRERKFGQKDEEYIFSASLLIEHIVQPWFACAAGGDELIESIAQGISELSGAYGADHYHSLMGAMFIAIGNNLSNGRLHEPNEKERMEILQALLFLTYRMAE